MIDFIQNIFKRKHKINIHPDNTSIESGILFEDTNQFLMWGVSTRELSEILNCKVKKQGDRTSYFWGKHKILNGLELPLMTEFWNFGEELKYRQFNHIEYRVVGDKVSQEYYKIIFDHLKIQFSEPIRNEIINKRENIAVWKIENVNLTLHLFEMHCYRLSFRIESIG